MIGWIWKDGWQEKQKEKEKEKERREEPKVPEVSANIRKMRKL